MKEIGFNIFLSVLFIELVALAWVITIFVSPVVSIAWWAIVIMVAAYWYEEVIHPA